MVSLAMNNLKSCPRCLSHQIKTITELVFGDPAERLRLVSITLHCFACRRAIDLTPNHRISDLSANVVA